MNGRSSFSIIAALAVIVLSGIVLVWALRTGPLFKQGNPDSAEGTAPTRIVSATQIPTAIVLDANPAVVQTAVALPTEATATPPAKAMDEPSATDILPATDTPPVTDVATQTDQPPPPTPQLTATPQVTATPSRLALFILAGQSNMSGRGPVPEGQTTDPRIVEFANDYTWQLAREPVDSPEGQVDTISRDPTAGYGPSMAFARALLEKNPNLRIGLIPCARGDSTIDQWQRDASDKTLYGSCLKRVRAAAAQGDVAGILFLQGESDAWDPQKVPQLTLSANTWADKFVRMANDWRADLGKPQLPIVYAQLGNISLEAFPNRDAVKAQQRAVQLPFSAMITTDDLPLLDHAHFTAESFDAVGQRFAQAYWQLVGGGE